MPSRCAISARYNGPTGSANGGYACGTFAAAGAQAGWERAVVTLHLPPPVDTDLAVEHGEVDSYVRNGGDLVATVSAATGGIPVVLPEQAEVAEACQAAFPGSGFHPFPSCFVCGVTRPGDDGLALRPGPVPGRARTVACTWRPDASLTDAAGDVRREIVWAALDCPGAWMCDLARQPMVLGRMTADINRVPSLGERCVLLGRSAPPEGRKITSHTALYAEDGALLAAASAIWITIPAGDVPPPRPAGRSRRG